MEDHFDRLPGPKSLPELLKYFTKPIVDDAERLSRKGGVRHETIVQDRVLGVK